MDKKKRMSYKVRQIGQGKVKLFFLKNLVEGYVGNKVFLLLQYVLYFFIIRESNI